MISPRFNLPSNFSKRACVDAVNQPPSFNPIAACDPGASGGLVIRDSNGTLGSFAMPHNDAEIVELLRLDHTGARPTLYIEALVKYTGFDMRSSSMATYAGNYGFVRGVAMAHGYTVVAVQPRAWQKAVGVTRPKKTEQTVWKNMLKAKAQELFPNEKITLKTADAFLILAAVLTGKV
jgi:hypothetical protein